MAAGGVRVDFLPVCVFYSKSRLTGYDTFVQLPVGASIGFGKGWLRGVFPTKKPKIGGFSG